MTESHYLHDIIVFLLATVVVVPLFERMRASPLVGYLVAGAIIGPNGLAVISDPDGVRTFAELGIAVLLFTIGLELTIARFRLLGAPSFWAGVGQVTVTGVIIGGLALTFGQTVPQAIVIGGALSFSSTAVVLQLLVERHEMATRVGRMALAILLLQDLAVGPFLVLIPMLEGGGDSLGSTLILAGVKALLVLAAIVVFGRMVLRPLFLIVEEARAPELSTAAILFVIIGTGLLTHWVGLSMALGAFVAGMVLAETEYRHKVMTDIQPFRGLLLGLFFMAVGMYIDVRIIIEIPALILGMVLALLIGKAVILFFAARMAGMTWVGSARIGLLLAQGGSFAFVLFSLALAEGVMGAYTVQVLMLVVAITMAVTPLLAVFGGWLSVKLEPDITPGLDALEAEAATLEGHIVVVGYGPVGKTVARRFLRQGVPFVVLDKDIKKVIDGTARGYPVFLADGIQPDAMDAANVAECQAIVVCIGEAKGAAGLVALLRYLFPDMRILAQARDERHGRDLVRAGATETVAEVQEAGDRLASAFVVPVDD